MINSVIFMHGKLKYVSVLFSFYLSLSLSFSAYFFFFSFDELLTQNSCYGFNSLFFFPRSFPSALYSFALTRNRFTRDVERVTFTGRPRFEIMKAEYRTVSLLIPASIVARVLCRSTIQLSSTARQPHNEPIDASLRPAHNSYRQ